MAEYQRGLSHVENVVRSAWEAMGKPPAIELRGVEMGAYDDPATVFSFCGQARGGKDGPYGGWKLFGTSVSTFGEVATAVQPDPRVKGICALGERPSFSDPEVAIGKAVKAFNASLKTTNQP